MLLAMAVSVTVLMNDKGAQDDARIVHHQVTTFEQCEIWQRNMRSAPKSVVDTITGQKIAGVYFECVPVQPGELSSMIDQAKNP